jgi:hypothetical protein
MADQTKTMIAKAIEEDLAPIRAKLDQLVKQAEDEGFHIQRSTTEALLDVLGDLQILEEKAREIDHKRVLDLVVKERGRCRQGLGLESRKRRRGR